MLGNPRLKEARRLCALGLSVIPVHAPGMPLPEGFDEHNAGKVPLIRGVVFRSGSLPKGSAAPKSWASTTRTKRRAPAGGNPNGAESETLVTRTVPQSIRRASLSRTRQFPGSCFVRRGTSHKPGAVAIFYPPVYPAIHPPILHPSRHP